jgi:hypothetical protein
MPSRLVVTNPLDHSPFPPFEVVTGTPIVLQDRQQANARTLTGPITVYAPLTPAAKFVFAVLDVDENAATNAITIDGNGNLIDGLPSLSFEVNGAACLFVFDGVQWRRLVERRMFDGSGPEVELAIDDPSGGPAPPTAPALQLIWRPGVATGGNHVETWPEVEAAITAAAGIITIIIDDTIAPCVVPATSNVDCLGNTVFTTATAASRSVFVEILDGGRIRNPASIENYLFFYAAGPTVVSPFFFDVMPYCSLTLRYGGSLLCGGGAVPMVSVASPLFYLQAQESAQLFSAGPPLFELPPGGDFEFYIFDGLQSTYGANLVAGPVGSVWNTYCDLSYVGEPQPGFLGVSTVTLLDKPAVIFDDVAFSSRSNVRTDRVIQSPIDRTKLGITNLGSDTNPGFNQGATEDYATIGGGDQNSATGTGATVAGGIINTASGLCSSVTGGTNCHAGSSYGFVGGGNACQDSSAVGGVIGGGDGNTLTGETNQATIAGGITNTITAHFGAIAGGVANTVAAEGGAVGGGYLNSAGGRYSSIPGGKRGETTRTGQHTTGHGDFTLGGRGQVSRYTVGGEANSIFGLVRILTDTDGGQLSLVEGRAYAVRARCVATQTSPAGNRALWLDDLLVHMTGGIAIIDASNSVWAVPNGNAWTIAYTAVGADIVATFTGTAGQQVRAMVDYDFSEIVGA